MIRSSLFLLKPIAFFAITISVASAHAQSGTKSSASRAYLNNNNIPSSGVALEGYCPVAYFAVNKPVMGKRQFASTHKGVTYYLVNTDAKAAFDKSPDQYIPAYGGWCALGMAVGDKFPVDPTNFKIVNGKLNLFLRNKNVDALAIWNKADETGQVSKAQAHWRKVNQ